MFHLHTRFYMLFIDCRHETEGLLITLILQTNYYPNNGCIFLEKSISTHWRQCEVMLPPHNFPRPLGYYERRKLKLKRSILQSQILFPTSSGFSGLHTESCNGRTSGPNHIEMLRIAVIYSTLQSLRAVVAWFGSSKTMHQRDFTV